MKKEGNDLKSGIECFHRFQITISLHMNPQTEEKLVIVITGLSI